VLEKDSEIRFTEECAVLFEQDVGVGGCHSGRLNILLECMKF